MINKTIKALMTLIAISSLSSFAYAGSFGIGVSGNIASVSADGTEATPPATGTEATDNSVKTATAGNDFMFGSIFAEYNFGDSERFTLGVDWIPGSADVNSKNISRTDTDSGDAEAVNEQMGTRTANAEISDHITYYAELGIVGGIYAKAGFAQVDIKTNDKFADADADASTVGNYPNKTLDAWTYGLGYKGTFGTNGFYKVEGYAIDYDTYSASSGTGNTVTANLDVVGAALKLGYKF